MITADPIDQRKPPGEGRRILDQVGAGRIVDPKQRLAARKNVFRAPFEHLIRTNLEPGRVLQVHLHELHRQQTHAEGEQENHQEYYNAISKHG